MSVLLSLASTAIDIRFTPACSHPSWDKTERWNAPLDPILFRIHMAYHPLSDWKNRRL